MYLIRMPTQGVSLLACARIPHLERPVFRGRYDKVSRLADRTSIHPKRMPTQGVLFLARLGIPDLERLVTRCRYDKVFCWADRTTPHPICMPTQFANQCRIWQVRQQVPVCQIWSRNIPLECLAQF